MGAWPVFLCNSRAAQCPALALGAYSGKAVHRAFATQGQEAFLEGHIDAFTELGGIPVKHIKYDNLKSAVTTVAGFASRVFL